MTSSEMQLPYTIGMVIKIWLIQYKVLAMLLSLGPTGKCMRPKIKSKSELNCGLCGTHDMKIAMAIMFGLFQMKFLVDDILR